MAISHEMEVAMAAPRIPHSGKGPMPKISSGSSMPLTRPATVMTRLGVLVSPVARMAELPTMGSTSMGTVRYQISM